MNDYKHGLVEGLGIAIKVARRAGGEAVVAELERRRADVLDSESLDP